MSVFRLFFRWVFQVRRLSCIIPRYLFWAEGEIKYCLYRLGGIQLSIKWKWHMMILKGWLEFSNNRTRCLALLNCFELFRDVWIGPSLIVRIAVPFYLVVFSFIGKSLAKYWIKRGNRTILGDVCNCCWMVRKD